MDMKPQIPQEDESSGFFIILGIIIFIFGMIVISIFFFNGLDYVKENFFTDEEDEQVFSLTLRTQDSLDKELLSTDYRLTIGEFVVQEGEILPSVIEKFSNARNGTIYTFHAKREDYYPKQIPCVVDDETCSLDMDKIGKTFFNCMKIKEDNYNCVLTVDEGFYHSPLICLAWHDMISANSTLYPTDVPTEFYNDFDVCYLMRDVQPVNTFFVSYDGSDDGYVDLKIMDKCEMSYKFGCARDYFVDFRDLVTVKM